MNYFFIVVAVHYFKIVDFLQCKNYSNTELGFVESYLDPKYLSAFRPTLIIVEANFLPNSRLLPLNRLFGQTVTPSEKFWSLSRFEIISYRGLIAFPRWTNCWIQLLAFKIPWVLTILGNSVIFFPRRAWPRWKVKTANFRESRINCQAEYLQLFNV